MSGETICLLGFLVFSIMLICVSVLLRSVVMTGEQLRLRDLIQLFREARDPQERGFLILLALLYSVKKVYLGLLLTLATGSLSFLGTLCGIFDFKSLLDFLLDVAALLTRK